MEMIGVERARSRDVATGIVLGAATGCSALFLYLDTTRSATTGATQQILFGSIFTIDPSTVPTIVILSAATLLGIGVIHRPLLLGSVSADLASARGISLRVIGLLFMLALAVAVGLSSIAIGSILSTALLIGPAATALRITRSLRAAMAVACFLGILTTWLGILLAYDSVSWDPSSQGLPVSFFIVAIVFLLYLASGLPFVRRLSGRRAGLDPHRGSFRRDARTRRLGQRPDVLGFHGQCVGGGHHCGDRRRGGRLLRRAPGIGLPSPRHPQRRLCRRRRCQPHRYQPPCRPGRVLTARRSRYRLSEPTGEG